MHEPPRPKIVLDHVKPTVVRRRVVSDPRAAAADEPPPSSIFPHPDHDRHDDEEEAD